MSRWLKLLNCLQTLSSLGATLQTGSSASLPNAVDAQFALGVGLLDVREHGLTLLLIELWCVGARQADVEGDRLEAVVPGDDDPQVAVDLARWISAPFAVWMDGWFLESVQQA